METTITFRTDSSLKSLIKENAARNRTSVSVYLTDLIKQVFSHNGTARPRELPLSENIRKYMGIVKDADGDWKEARDERLNEKYEI